MPRPIVLLFAGLVLHLAVQAQTNPVSAGGASGPLLTSPGDGSSSIARLRKDTFRSEQSRVTQRRSGFNHPVICPHNPDPAYQHAAICEAMRQVLDPVTLCGNSVGHDRLGMPVIGPRICLDRVRPDEE